MFFNTSL